MSYLDQSGVKGDNLELFPSHICITTRLPNRLLTHIAIFLKLECNICRIVGFAFRLPFQERGNVQDVSFRIGGFTSSETGTTELSIAPGVSLENTEIDLFFLKTLLSYFVQKKVLLQVKKNRKGTFYITGGQPAAQIARVKEISISLKLGIFCGPKQLVFFQCSPGKLKGWTTLFYTVFIVRYQPRILPVCTNF